VEALIRERLLPGQHFEVVFGSLLRRGCGTQTPSYGGRVHNDYGLTADHCQGSAEAHSTPESAQVWWDRKEKDDVAAYGVINFWRTSNFFHTAFAHPGAPPPPRRDRAANFASGCSC